ncbi:stabilizer of axonemal microtubules 1-like [Copidosoma floridanum]|uniref:stabilizer of axonemal microtubules 1-like n=1 Tax=Copidosoma floridanum TaxID=29053 RepID=UPI0006C9A315|nr:stabilizer of axonemal microtubules 1-like [Copidosoma floridanum]
MLKVISKTYCTRKYVQPPRVKPFAPRSVYCRAKNPIDTKTTYHLSYQNEDQVRQAPVKPIKPVNSISLPQDKLPSDTTNKLSYLPVCGIYKAEPILPRPRLRPQQGTMECLTTIRKDFEPKYASRPEMIVPCGQIRTSKGAFSGKTTTLLSYMNPGPVEAVPSYRPKMRYCQPSQPTATETTQKLSYVPHEMAKKEKYPWARKPVYRAPEVAMPGETTYKKTYLESKSLQRDLPILPKDAGVLPSGTEFVNDTVYRESFLPASAEPVAPFLPSQNITLSDKRMTCVTTNELSYKAVGGERRKPIMPRSKKILCNAGSMQNETTNREAFGPKIAQPPKAIKPRGNIHSRDQSLMETKTVTALSFAKPGPVPRLQNYKPIAKYCKPDSKIEDETISKMSYPRWSIGPKEELPWAQKGRYKSPKDAMPTCTVYHMSFPAPGYYVEESEGCESTKP